MEVKEILSKGSIQGHSIVNYLKEQGHSEVALFFEKDIHQRFSLAIQCGNLNIAFESAKEINTKECF